MEKKPFQVEYEKIEVPQEEVLQAIQTGINRATATKSVKKRLKPYLLAATAALFITASFISPSISYVMAEVPFIGKVYENVNDLVGRNLASQQLITQLNETASNQGIDISIKSAYYDGAVMGVTFYITGDVQTEADGRLIGFYKLFDGKEEIADSKELVYLDPTEGGYVGHIRLYYPKTELPPNATFPLEFKRIGTKEGAWKFDVPIQQLPYKTIQLQQKSSAIDTDVSVLFDAIIQGQASTAINYTATFPREGKHDQVRLEIFDDKGRQLPLLADGIDLETSKDQHFITVQGRTIIPQPLAEVTSYLTISPKVAVYEKDRFITLEQPTPIHIDSARQKLGVTVEKITLKDEKLTIDFHFNSEHKDFILFENFARNNVELVEESEKKVYKKLIKHTTKAIDKDNLRFRSTFNIGTIHDFSTDNYVLRVNFNTLHANIPVELDTVKVDLN
ncbi:DUF4179 domain-containing protein [Lysinibacillus sp. FSL H8-0500]|uniref:DUF4179 domain-containing protein n=1 Tax=Lysinibacillus sp. FSL H8-0500 TaxID=2921393 RepID=UPI0031014A76